ncbi:MAG: TonB-dependent receptor [Gemmatimonadetes bacterium]|nr:TonB-dependent receptor [Gemmatimonadota bacterium]
MIGTVVADDGRPVEGARVAVTRRQGASGTEALTDSRGAFRLPPLAPGLYSLTVRQLGFRPASLAVVRVVAGDTVSVRVSLTRAPAQLSTVVVIRSPASIDALSPESPRRIERETALLLPTPRDASSVIALVPGAKDGRLWGGAGAVTNDFKLDGVSLNHPGVGGDFLQLPRDWVETVEIRGIGANAEFGNFQGGVVNAITRTGSNVRTAAFRSFFESERLTATNFDLDEQGAEQAGRTELSGEAGGAILQDRLFYFVGAQAVSRTFRSPDLVSTPPGDFLGARETQRDLRGIGKLTWLRAPGERMEALLGVSDRTIANAGINGIDGVSALQRVRAPTLWYSATWRRELTARTSLDLRLAGYDARERRDGNGGAGTPAVRELRLGNLPVEQNAEFDERSEPSSHSAALTMRHSGRAFGAEHQLAWGAELTLGEWNDALTRNGGVTWRPYVVTGVPFSATDASTWTTTGSDWGGEVHLRSRTRSTAYFVQDQITIGSRITLSPGIRFSTWTGWLTPCAAVESDPVCAGRLRAASAKAFDPRVGVSWDVTGRNTLAIKAHWGRYHQGMYALFFDRASGANIHSNERFYYAAPPLTSSRTTFDTAARDSLLGPGGFSPFWDEEIRNESGVVKGYRQPYVDQLSIGVEKTLGAHWKLELLALARTNGDIVGLVDRNMASNYTALSDIAVGHRLLFGTILDAQGRPLVLDRLWVSNRDLIDQVLRMNANLRPGAPPRCFGGWCPADLGALTFDPRIELAPIASARRRYGQLTTTLTAAFADWRAEGSVTVARLEGNVAGVTGHGVTGSRFSAGPFVRPNEAENFNGALPDATEFEAKVWLTARLPFGLKGGFLFTHILGERTTPSFTILGRYRYTDRFGETANEELTRQVLGQQLFVESRGSRNYASRTMLDLHVERALPLRVARQAALSVDLFNALGSRAVTRAKTEIDDQSITDPSSTLGATRQRVAPRSIRIGVRIGS